jgi:hypothetical protein
VDLICLIASSYLLAAQNPAVFPVAVKIRLSSQIREYILLSASYPSKMKIVIMPELPRLKSPQIVA